MPLQVAYRGNGLPYVFSITGRLLGDPADRVKFNHDPLMLRGFTSQDCAERFLDVVHRNEDPDVYLKKVDPATLIDEIDAVRNQLGGLADHICVNEWIGRGSDYLPGKPFKLSDAHRIPV